MPKAIKARRRSRVGRRPCFSAGEGVEKREKAERISDSVEAGMEFSFARADWRGGLGLEEDGAGARRLGGCGGGLVWESGEGWAGRERMGEAGFTIARVAFAVSGE